MAIKVPNSAEVLALKAFLNHTPQDEDQLLKLFKNNYTPVEASVAGDFTEATFTGYSAIALTGSSWTISSGDPATAVYAEQTFTSSADQTAELVYGYYIVRDTGGEILWAERFSSPVSVSANGDYIKVTPRITQKDESD